ncbi:MAG: P-loop ATPase, MinD superfamily, partial [Mesotoga infera]
MVIAVLSGKGGTGKTTLATNLASAISEDFDVQLL